MSLFSRHKGDDYPANRVLVLLDGQPVDVNLVVGGVVQGSAHTELKRSWGGLRLTCCLQGDALVIRPTDHVPYSVRNVDAIAVGSRHAVSGAMIEADRAFDVDAFEYRVFPNSGKYALTRTVRPKASCTITIPVSGYLALVP